MKDPLESNDEPVRGLLQSARPAPPLPPRFQEGVWRRIESHGAFGMKVRPLSAWLEQCVEWLLVPRFAVASLAFLLVAGGLAGLLSSAGAARQQAQERYVSAVAPEIIR